MALGLDLERYRALDRAMVITYSEFHYLQASREGQEIAVATWIVDWDRKLTMARRFQVVRVDDGVTLLRAAMRFACIELSSGRPAAAATGIHRRLWTGGTGWSTLPLKYGCRNLAYCNTCTIHEPDQCLIALDRLA